MSVRSELDQGEVCLRCWLDRLQQDKRGAQEKFKFRSGAANYFRLARSGGMLLIEILEIFLLSKSL